MVKKLAIAAAAFFILILFLYIIAYWNNNKETNRPEQADIRHSLDLAINWLVKNENKIMQHHNSALWWMIKNASETGADTKLSEVFDTYSKNYISFRPEDMWMSFFNDRFRPHIPDISLLTGFDDYQLFLIYSLTCDAALSSEPVIKAQFSPQYCSLHFIHPRCVTHQLIGARFLYERNCSDKEQLNQLIKQLQIKVVTQLEWDFRVGDAYIQRLLTLQESGVGESIKPVWLARFLAAQNKDGGWSDYHPLLTLPNGYSFGFTSKLPALKKARISDFHATAQAIWLLTLLLQEN